MAQGVGWAKSCMRAGDTPQQYTVRGSNTKVDPELIRRKRRDRIKIKIQSLYGKRRVAFMCYTLLSIPLCVIGLAMAYAAFSDSSFIDRRPGFAIVLILMFLSFGLISLKQNAEQFIKSHRRIKDYRAQLIEL